MLWSWILEGVGITGALIAGRKHWTGWLMLLGNTVLWAIYGISTKQYGFVVASLFYAPVYLQNLIRWRKELPISENVHKQNAHNQR